MIQVYCKNTGTTKSFREGTTLLDMLPELRGCQVHCTVLLSEVDRKIFRKLGVGLTCDPVKKKYFANGK